MELNLHPIATKSFVSGREFAEHDRVVSYLVQETVNPGDGRKSMAVVRRDLLEAEDPPSFLDGNYGAASLPPLTLQAESPAPAEKVFVYCRWVTDYKPRRNDDSALALKLTAENLFLTLAIPAGSDSPADSSPLTASGSSLNTPLLQFLALMLERKRLIKLRGLTEDGGRQIYEHMPSHQMYEVPVGDLNVEFFQKIQEHLGVLVGTPKVSSKQSAVNGQAEPSGAQSAASGQEAAAPEVPATS